MINYKQRTIQLSLGILSFFFITYFLSIKHTIRHYKKCKQAKRTLQQQQNLKKNIAQLKSELHNFALSPLITEHSPLVDDVLSFCQEQNLSIKQLQEPQIKEAENYKQIRHDIEVQGTFKGSVQLIDYLENKQRLGKMISTTFYTEENRQKKTTQLKTHLVLQNIERN